MTLWRFFRSTLFMILLSPWRTSLSANMSLLAEKNALDLRERASVSCSVSAAVVTRAESLFWAVAGVSRYPVFEPWKIRANMCYQHDDRDPCLSSGREVFGATLQMKGAGENSREVPWTCSLRRGFEGACFCVCVYFCDCVCECVCAGHAGNQNQRCFLCVCDVSRMITSVRVIKIRASTSRRLQARLLVCMHVCLILYVCVRARGCKARRHMLRRCVFGICVGVCDCICVIDVLCTKSYAFKVRFWCLRGCMWLYTRDRCTHGWEICRACGHRRLCVLCVALNRRHVFPRLCLSHKLWMSRSMRSMRSMCGFELKTCIPKAVLEPQVVNVEV